jgi:hypothetical protein
MFQHKATGEGISGFKGRKPLTDVVDWATVSAPAPPAARVPQQEEGVITFTFSPPCFPKPLPPPPVPSSEPVARIALPALKLPFLSPLDEAMCRLFRRQPTPLDMVVRTVFAKYECNFVPLAHITMIMGEYGMALTSALQLVGCQTGPFSMADSWGYYFPYFDARQHESKQWLFGLSVEFYKTLQ